MREFSNFAQNCSSATNATVPQDEPTHEEVRTMGMLFRSKMSEIFDRETILLKSLEYFEKNYPERYLNVKG
jgi:hypothetical protein